MVPVRVPESEQSQQSPPPQPDAARYPLQERYASARDFLAELSEYHGEDTYIVSPDKSLVLARCPACFRRPKSEGITRYKLMISRSGPTEYGWGVSAWCGCSDERIAAVLMMMKADQLHRHAVELEASVLASETSDSSS